MEEVPENNEFVEDEEDDEVDIDDEFGEIEEEDFDDNNESGFKLNMETITGDRPYT